MVHRYISFSAAPSHSFRKGKSSDRQSLQSDHGYFILHPILLAGIQAVYTPAGTFSAVALWLFLTVLSGAITFVIGKIPLVNLLIRT